MDIFWVAVISFVVLLVIAFLWTKVFVGYRDRIGDSSVVMDIDYVQGDSEFLWEFDDLELLDHLNNWYSRRGLRELKVDSALRMTAKDRSRLKASEGPHDKVTNPITHAGMQDSADNLYRKYGIRNSAELIYVGTSDPYKAFLGFVGSSVHRKILLSTSRKFIGIYSDMCLESRATYWVIWLSK
jgi:hypothetical protein